MTVSPKYMCLKRLDYVFNFLNHSRSKSNHNWVEGGGGESFKKDNNNKDTQTSSKHYKENGDGLDLDSLIISY